MAHRQPFKPTLPGISDVDPTLDSNVQPRPISAMHNRDPNHLTASTAPTLNLSGLRKSSLKKADVTEREAASAPPDHLLPTSSTAMLGDSNALFEVSQSSNLAQRGAPAFAMPYPLKFAAQQSPAFISANNPLFRAPSRTESTRKHAQPGFPIPNIIPSSTPRLVPGNADTILRPSSAGNALHIDGAEYSRFTRHLGNVKTAVNADVATPPVFQSSHLRSTSHEYSLPEDPLHHNLSERVAQERLLIPAEDESHPGDKSVRDPRFTTAGKRGLDEDSRHGEDSDALTSGSRKRQRLYNMSPDSVGPSDLVQAFSSLGTQCASLTYQVQEPREHGGQDNHPRATDLHHEFDRFYFSEAARMAQLREKWSNCSMEEWQEGGTSMYSLLPQSSLYSTNMGSF